jgi:hypothetical protein
MTRDDAERLKEKAYEIVRNRLGLANKVGERVHEFLLRELERLDGVEELLVASADDGSPALLLISGPGDVYLWRFDKVGARVASWGKLKGVGLETMHAISETKDERIESWTLRHPYFPRNGTLTIDASSVPQEEHENVDASLRRLVERPNDQ